jgi:isopenicillin N synthase-like dioxygenase
MRRAVPIIDISPFHEGSDKGRLSVARQVDQACRDIGFLVVLGHGLEKTVIDDAFREAYAFFDLDEDAKQALSVVDGRGYFGVGRQALARSRGEETPPDLFERFSMGPFDIPEDDYHRSMKRFFAANRWPRERPGFRRALEVYYRSAEQLAGQLMSAFALALDLPSSYFEPMIDRHISDLCLNHYPAQTVPPLPGQLRAGAHTDYGSLTIVAPSDAPGGLEVMTPSGAWEPVPWIEDGFVVNIGDLMAQWTNDRWVSTMHRVVNPPRTAGSDGRRLSIVFFHQPNGDATISAIPTCVSDGASPLYAPTTSGEHLMMKVNRHLLVHET